MKAKLRMQLTRRFGHLYHRLVCDGSACIYCGDPRSCLDHVPPLIVLDCADPSTLIEKLKVPFLLVPACTYCNSALGGRHLLELPERIDYITRRLEKFYERRSVVWTQEEIALVGYQEQLMLSAMEHRRKVLLARVRFAQEQKFKIFAILNDNGHY